MIDLSAVLSTVQVRLKKLSVGQRLELWTFKKDRSLIIVKLADDMLQVVENGYARAEYMVASAQLKKLLKTLLKKEFPRSNKVHLYTR
ncbi:MAG: hypothetical protein H8E79_06905 [Desulfobulbaceae bacterium]|uniref:Uncharacterized protein n=1 Tax=Candidatus Desulfatifera sulfidica TaxID=2841691 RepID=A0A8J6N8L0_9BACT|nr:hypothetical protein [Candidatus Desulfatifera sulfidica]